MPLPRAKKSFGQNFLQDASVLGKIVDAAEIEPGEAVLEIGPGTGVLTRALLDAGARVTAVEADHDLIAPLREKFGERIELIEGNVLNIDLKDIFCHSDRSPEGAKRRNLEIPPLPSVGRDDKTFKLVANIPYNITSPILERFLAHEPRPSRMVLMVQKEVADRITAKPPRMGLLSVACQLYAECRKVATVPRGAFRPIPKVDSAIVRLDLRDLPVSLLRKEGAASYPSPYEGEGMGEVLDPEKVIRLAKAGFSHPRKQLHGNLAAAGFGTSGQAQAALTAIGLDPKARAETLSVDEWVSLGKALSVL